MRRRFLMLIICLFIAVPALAEPALFLSDPMVEDRLWVTGVAAAEQGLYIQTIEEGLYLWDGTGETPRVVLPAGQPAGADLLVGDGQRVWLVQTYQGGVFEINWREDGVILPEQPVALDFTDLANQDGILLWESRPNRPARWMARCYGPHGMAGCLPLTSLAAAEPITTCPT